MAVLQLDDQQFPLTGDTTRIGSGAEADVALPGDAALGVQAVIVRTGTHGLHIRRAAPQSQVRVNGVLLGPEPTPLMHGDKVEVSGLELRFADESKRGATQYVSMEAIAAMAGTKRAGAARPTAASGGRLVSLVDGKEYTVPSSGVVIGRDAGCDVVIGKNEVSRRHAEVAPTDQGYFVRDMSSNGVFVNGERVRGSQRLARADVIRVGGEEFRFYADMPAPTPADGELAEAEAAATSPVASLADTLHFAPLKTPVAAPVSAAEAIAIAPAPAEVSPPVLATLEVLNEGLSKGNRYTIRTPLAHVGRGAHNDVRLTDESVSETHAKLQRRDDGWYAVDMNSTNGTYVGGSRVTGERRLDGAPDVRFGGVKLRFVPADYEAASEAKAARAVVAPDKLKVAPKLAPLDDAVTAPAQSRNGVRWALLALAIAAAVFFVLRGRA
jgi:pSer/pThr/pTyr-binding forkhead associated (FHA) protein